MTPKTKWWFAAGIALVAAGLVATASVQMADYGRRVALLYRLTHEVGGPATTTGSMPSAAQLIAPGLEVVAAVALAAVLTGTLVRARRTARESSS